MTKEYNIVRRAWGKREVVETFSGEWHKAECFAMSLQATKNDGEYSAIPVEHGMQYPDEGGVDQSTLPIAWL